MIDSPKPTAEEQSRFSLRSFKGIEAGLGQADPVATIAQKLEEKHAGHLILVQSGNFLHGYDRTAYALATLKKYKLKLVGAATEPHIRIGFPGFEGAFLGQIMLPSGKTVMEHVTSQKLLPSLKDGAA